MVIEEKDFKIIPIDNSSLSFDLELLYTVNKGKEKERTEFRNCGYGLSLENALKKVIMYRISNKHEVLDLKTFLKEFKLEANSVKSLCKDLTDIN